MNVRSPPLQSFRNTKDEPAFAGSKHLQMFALSLVHQCGELLKLKRRHVLGEKGDDVLDAALMCREHLKRIADKEQVAFDDAVRVEDRDARIEAVGEEQKGALVFHRSAAIGEQRARRIVDRNGESSAHDALGSEARPEVRRRLR